jgi:hypothetical protein
MRDGANIVKDPVAEQPECESEVDFVPLDGMWRFEGSKATYTGPVTIPERGFVGEHGYCLTKRICRSSRISVEATIKNEAAAARVVFGYDSSTGDYSCWLPSSSESQATRW